MENLTYLFRATFTRSRSNRILTENSEPIMTENNEYIEIDTNEDDSSSNSNSNT